MDELQLRVLNERLGQIGQILESMARLLKDIRDKMEFTEKTHG